MRRLNGLDTMFVSVESNRVPTHVTCVTIVDPATTTEPYTFERIKGSLAARLDLLAPFRRRLVEVPFGIGRPYWVEDPDFDLESHVRRTAIVAPGGDRELTEAIAGLIERPLDRSRPLWEWWVVEGLDGGKIANVLKIHHSYIDGMSGASLQETLFDHDPDAPPPPQAEQPWQPEQVPNSPQVLLRSLIDLSSSPRTLGRMVRSATTTGRRMAKLVASSDRPSLPRAPRTRFNRPVSPHRSVAFLSIPLDEVKEVKSAFDVKVNDVVLALCAGALRRVLDDLGELPDEPLVGAVPVSIRSEGDREVGNQVSAMIVSLATDIADPVERLHAIYANTQSSKQMQEALGAELIMSLVDVPPPALVSLGNNVIARTGLAQRGRPFHTLAISNVPGPRRRHYHLGAEVEAFYSTGIVFDGAGLFIGLMSYLDQMDVGILACREILPDPWPLADAIREELAVLLERSRQEAPARR